ncbi:hypothetical protein [Paraflavitalea speifideaquila]|uniref:hypothetical protein n=1 Tax=Paraflavitalea speifideaquila TaxID=3076558 RepID=UPI0028E8136B|nr:hypothetical protein [Paraflavitalea speifideiaquila]
MFTGKVKYVFRKPALSYNDLYNYRTKGNKEYANRWQKPGDETSTTVPSSPDALILLRDEFYANAAVNTEKADHIRLHQVQLGVTIPTKMLGKIPVTNCNLSISAYNLGILWKATETTIDPDYINELPMPISMAVSLKIDF